MPTPRNLSPVSRRPDGTRRRGRRYVLIAAALFAASVAPAVTAASAASAAPAQRAAAHHPAVRPAIHQAGTPDFGPNVYVFTPSMPQSQIQATVDSIASQQVSNQFGTQRYALLFEPGTYGSAADPLFFQVGYYTSVAGLGASPGDVVINGAVDSFNQCDASGSCTALVNFWRSLSNLTINFPTPQPGGPCSQSAEFWATSQASPVRRVDVNGFTSLEDYCSAPSFSSGGFIADSQFSGSTVLNGTQQQFVVRNSNLDGWTNAVWNQVFSGDVGAPAQNFGSGGQYTTLAASPVTQEEPFLQQDSAGNYSVFVPAVQHNSVGTTWGSGPTPGTAIPIQRFFIASPSTPVGLIDAALLLGKDLILTPGVYSLNHPDRGDPAGHRGARPRLPHAGARARQPRDAGGQRSRGEAVRHDVRRRAGELARAAAGGAAGPGLVGPGRPDPGAGRVLPRRRCHARPGQRQPRGQLLAGDPRRHLGLAGRPRQRRGLDQQRREHRRGLSTVTT